MQRLILFITYILLISLLSWGAEVGDTISNSAYVEYRIGSQDKNLTTNEANATVVQTAATIELLGLTPLSGDLYYHRDYSLPRYQWYMALLCQMAYLHMALYYSLQCL